MIGMTSRQKRIVFSIVLLVMLSSNVLQLIAATEEDLGRLKAGMPKTEVIQIMGKPDAQGVSKDENLSSWFTYKHVGRYRYVNIWFDSQDRVFAIDKARR
jgi:hypothetical protein